MAIDWAAEIEVRDLRKVTADIDADALDVQISDAIEFLYASVPHARRAVARKVVSSSAFIRVVCDLVLRKLGNLEGTSTESDGVYSYGLSATVASGDFWLPQKDRDIFGSVSAGIGSVSVGLDRGWGR